MSLIDFDDVTHRYNKYKKNANKLIEEIKELRSSLEKKNNSDDFALLIQLNEALCQILFMMTIYLKAIRSF